MLFDKNGEYNYLRHTISKKDFFNNLSNLFLDIQFYKDYPFSTNRDYTITKPIKQLFNLSVGYDNNSVILLTKEWGNGKE